LLLFFPHDSHATFLLQICRFPSEEYVCANPHLKSETVKYYTQGVHKYPDKDHNGRGGCTASDISKAVTTFSILTGTTILAATVGVLAQAKMSDPGMHAIW
jgi:hypothetical protein